jgi:predicted MFS family arabinose efflux permease
MGEKLWPASLPVSIIPVITGVGLLLVGAFVFLELRKSRLRRDPLFELTLLRTKTFRYGLMTVVVLAMGQLGISFVLPVFLQNAKHLTAERNGLWMLPAGIFVIVGAQIGGAMARRTGTTMVVRVGLLLYAVGILLILRAVTLDITVWRLLPGLALYGAGIGFAGAQLTNVVLSEVPDENAGAGSGANTTVRQVGSALGVSVIGALLTARTISVATSGLHATSLPAAVKAQAAAGVRALGSGYSPPAAIGPANGAVVRHAISQGVMSGTRWALVFAAVVIALGALLSLLIPNERVERETPLETLPQDVDPLAVDAAVAGGDL